MCIKIALKFLFYFYFIMLFEISPLTEHKTISFGMSKTDFPWMDYRANPTVQFLQFLLLHMRFTMMKYRHYKRQL